MVASLLVCITSVITLLFLIIQPTLPPGIHPLAADNAILVSAAFQQSEETSGTSQQQTAPSRPSNCYFRRLH